MLDGRRRLGSAERCASREVVGPRRGAEVDSAGRRARSRPGRNATLTFVRRSELGGRSSAAARDGEPEGWPEDLVDVDAGRRRRCSQRRGACFFAELVSGSALPTEAVEDALWDLLARGRVTADAVDNLRVLLSPAPTSPAAGPEARRPGALVAAPAGCDRSSEEERLGQHWRGCFLRRWGIVFRDLVVREPLAPAWRELVRHYRRMEARGEVRGGRFLAGVAGEQFALPEAVEVARADPSPRPTGSGSTVAGVDPLNLTGIVTPGPRVPAVMGTRVVYVDGIPAEDAPAAAIANRGTRLPRVVDGRRKILGDLQAAGRSLWEGLWHLPHSAHGVRALGRTSSAPGGKVFGTCRGRPEIG